MARILRYLRIAFSVTCGIACVLLVVLWVRSYSRFDQILGPMSVNTWICAQSLRGHIMFELQDEGHIPADIDPVWSWTTLGVGRSPRGTTYQLSNGEQSRLHFIVPIGLIVALTAVFPILPWLPWHFSLRTLLIATTVVAVVLGVIIYASR